MVGPWAAAYLSPKNQSISEESSPLRLVEQDWGRVLRASRGPGCRQSGLLSSTRNREPTTHQKRSQSGFNQVHPRQWAGISSYHGTKMEIKVLFSTIVPSDTKVRWYKID